MCLGEQEDLLESCQSNEEVEGAHTALKGSNHFTTQSNCYIYEPLTIMAGLLLNTLHRLSYSLFAITVQTETTEAAEVQFVKQGEIFIKIWTQHLTTPNPVICRYITGFASVPTLHIQPRVGWEGVTFFYSCTIYT